MRLTLALALTAHLFIPIQAEGPQSDHPGLSKRFDASKNKSKSKVLSVHPHGEQEGIAAARNNDGAANKAAGALSEETQKFLIQGWIKALGEFKSTKEALELIQNSKNPVNFKLVSGAEIKSGSIASYRNNTIFINGKFLEQVFEELRTQGASVEEIQEFIIYRTLPYIAHESTHGADENNLLLKGVDYPGSSFESEVTAHVNEVLTINEVKNKKGNIWNRYKFQAFDEDQSATLQAAQKGIVGIEDLVARAYKVNKLLSVDRAWLQAENERISKIGPKIVNKRKSLEKAIANVTTEEEKKPLRDQLAKLPSDDTAMERALVSERSAKTVSDPEKFKILQQFYREKLAEAEKQLSQR